MLCPPAGALIRERYPEVEKIARILRYKASISYQENRFFEERIYFAEPEFFELFNFKFIEGDPLTGIVEPNNAFISQSTAKKYYGDEDPIGKTFSIDKSVDYQVVGVFEDIPQNSHLKFDFLLSYKNLIALYGEDFQTAWGHTGMFTYLRVKPDTNPDELEKKFHELAEAECPWLKDYKMSIDLRMQPLHDIHLTSHYMQEYEVNGNRDSVNFLLIVVVFIIIMAWVNYVNLSTARSLTRAREVGLRKVVGASRNQLITQFFYETFLINFIALLISLLLVVIFTPSFSRFAAIPLEYSIWQQSWLWAVLPIMFFAGIILSGLYPVTTMSSFQPVKVLKGKLGTAAKGVNLRKALVIFQFVMALLLITSTITVFKQISYMRSQDLGFDMEQTLIIKAPRVRTDSYGEVFKTYKIHY